MDMSWRVFRNTWRRSDDWGLVVLNPDQMPVAASPQPYLEALVGLEKARQWDAAATGYGTALKRWPENLAALMGLGNSHYKLGDLDAAEAAFRKATQLHPGSGAAFNNLAQVLYETGRKAQALTAIHRAIAIGGPLSPVFQETLEMMLQR
jgi:tetratricopeptide (TPR) repeat protein